MVNKPWHRPATPANPAWFEYSDSPFATAQPIHGVPEGLGDPAEGYGDTEETTLADLLDELLDELPEQQRDVLSMHVVAGWPFDAIARHYGWFLPSAEPDRKKAYRIVRRALKKLRDRITENPDVLDEVSGVRIAELMTAK